ncbi:MAG: hypothetical protein JXA68_11450 [Ignavibacteriales bacterium]|nr:hypothetical protein [Ignavibacteriales bacterium]
MKVLKLIQVFFFIFLFSKCSFNQIDYVGTQFNSTKSVKVIMDEKYIPEDAIYIGEITGRMPNWLFASSEDLQTEMIEKAQ